MIRFKAQLGDETVVVKQFREESLSASSLSATAVSNEFRAQVWEIGFVYCRACACGGVRTRWLTPPIAQWPGASKHRPAPRYVRGPFQSGDGARRGTLARDLPRGPRLPPPCAS